MIYLFLCILACCSFGFFFKFYERFGINTFLAITINYITAGAVGLLVNSHVIFSLNILDQPWFGYSLLIGVLFVAIFYLIARSTQIIGLSATQIVNRMSLVIPVAFSVYLYGDSMSYLKAIGMVLALAAVYFTFKKKSETKAKFNLKLTVLPILIFLSGGFLDTLFKYVQEYYIKDDHMIAFITVLTCTAGITGLLINMAKSAKIPVRLDKKTLLGGVMLGIVNFCSLVLFFKALLHFQSSVVFSVNNIGIVTLSAIGGHFIFKEKLSLTNWGGVIIGAVSIVLITFN
ncbi:MAG: hypothetical protein COC01_04545 [Bacteroidetes bacterium]|nr:EamA family transporter [Sphingobacteriaceae bacterium AH-315-L07]PCH68098.1 MAG: hypothetical protein COC01_04545 [Bacteroidota bacterium]